MAGINGNRPDYDAVIIGGGFYGCCLALFLRSIFRKILIVEEEQSVMTRASRVNQARVHMGYHYPRSFVTALRSRKLSMRFIKDFPAAITDDFEMLYAIARRRSKVSGARFYRMFADMGAPIVPAQLSDAALFSPDLIESVFSCTEFAFDWSVLRSQLIDRLERFGINVMFGETGEAVEFEGDKCVVTLASGHSLRTQALFNVTYSGLNRILTNSGLDLLPLKHELAEIALITHPEELRRKAVTVMDGPFFSLMPFPSRGLYSLTHVRYTPHASWVDEPGRYDPHVFGKEIEEQSRWRHMVIDTQRYLPCVANVEHIESLFTIKTVLIRNEQDDGRPILLHRHHPRSHFYSVMGGKIDNIYDLFDVLPGLAPVFTGADDRYLFSRP